MSPASSFQIVLQPMFKCRTHKITKWYVYKYTPSHKDNHTLGMVHLHTAVERNRNMKAQSDIYIIQTLNVRKYKSKEEIIKI